MHPLSLARFSVKGAGVMERLQTIAIELKGEELEGVLSSGGPVAFTQASVELDKP